MPDFFKSIGNLFANPPELWQILFLLIFLLWIVASQVGEKLQETIAIAACLILLVALWIALGRLPNNPFVLYFRVIFTSFLVYLVLSTRLNDISKQILWISYPEIVGVSIIFPEWMNQKFKIKQLKRSHLERHGILLLSCLLMSCWIYFSFAINAWVAENPELAQKSMQKSLFVIKLPPDTINNNQQP
ncbi:DUF5357 family protein [Roseofilum casamattae]|uniref:DUF5357 family protein n=1 Tax=Roseofilum casamattae BLCC-M143 TaxID=3022442 RepID=A0ABT7BTS7_9CYAN|nr:DUF5357 family protein [Roseofilum casamattae]MDJ1182598.1 DUF5357 family protein [Roseofilum casamattae BLCC-M143]